MNFKLTIFPALEAKKHGGGKYFKFKTKPELLAAKNSTADLLLFLQDELKVMDDYSNIFICEELVNGDWEELDGEE